MIGHIFKNYSNYYMMVLFSFIKDNYTYVKVINQTGQTIDVNCYGNYDIKIIPLQEQLEAYNKYFTKYATMPEHLKIIEEKI